MKYLIFLLILFTGQSAFSRKFAGKEISGPKTEYKIKYDSHVTTLRSDFIYNNYYIILEAFQYEGIRISYINANNCP